MRDVWLNSILFKVDPLSGKVGFVWGPAEASVVWASIASRDSIAEQRGPGWDAIPGCYTASKVDVGKSKDTAGDCIRML